MKCADDTKLFIKTKEIGDKQKLQNYIDKLVRWSEKWQMLFKFGKCKYLHAGPGNTGMYGGPSETCVYSCISNIFSRHFTWNQASLLRFHPAHISDFHIIYSESTE